MRIVKRTVSALKTFGARFAGDRRGNVAMIFALALPPMLLMTLGGVDIARVSSVRVNVQDALDAATLAAARSQATDKIRINEVGLAALKANLAPYDDVILDTTNTTFRLNEATGVIEADATVSVKAMVANIFLPPYGQFFDDQLPVNAHSEVLRASGGLLEVALVIDNTGSMYGAKLTNTKAAAIDLINRLEAADAEATEEDAIKVSLVPFAMTVRVTEGGTNTPPSWMTDATDHTGGGVYSDPANKYSLFDANATGRFTLFSRLNTTWSGCVETRGAPYDIRETSPVAGTAASWFVPFFAPDEPDKGDYPKDSTWKNYDYEGNDYMDDGIAGITSSNPFGSGSAATAARAKAWWDRVRNTSRYSNTPRSTLSNYFGPNVGCRHKPIIRLTDDFNALRAGVRDMIAWGNTNVPLGAMWGWHTLSPNAPFGDGRAYDTPGLKKIIIIMTDGENYMPEYSSPNEGSYGGNGYIWQNRLGITTGSESTRRARMDDRLDSATPGTEDLCGNMKNANIEVFTIAVQVDDTAQALLRRCATNSSHYFEVDSASGIGDAFDSIAGAIADLRISR
ncbi:pilus assembly protein [Brevundimonas sp. AJA228-03]|uniref:TadE/TadG family type IV pilus assembly protein n=1 Tax=Brevundimonas sp. AJA228-03 TaxID=2752515 RepID=UPI001AE00E11|nr:TadE/TadG family type IV pilus assembly protein [Brevundimonas sp. AJA228-03]QTN19322.1 pilus assembly protein [Brevundimonas sp. AJA228-03]